MNASPPTLSAALRRTRARFAAAGIETPDIDARVLVFEILDADATALVLDGERVVDAAAAAALESAVSRRLTGEPVYRILGHRPFHGLDLVLGPATLEPRPDTETLVDAVLPHVRRIAAERSGCRILDLGTGTGAICLALLLTCPSATGVGVDVSPEALAVAVENARRHGLAERFAPCRSDWFQSVAGRYDVIVANPPYIPSGEMGGLSREVRVHDPAGALDGGADGLDAYRIIARDACRFLEPHGILGLEFGATQRRAVDAILAEAGYASLSHHADLGGRDRAVIAARADGRHR